MAALKLPPLAVAAVAVSLASLTACAGGQGSGGDAASDEAADGAPGAASEDAAASGGEGGSITLGSGESHEFDGADCSDDGSEFMGMASNGVADVIVVIDLGDGVGSITYSDISVGTGWQSESGAGDIELGDDRVAFTDVPATSDQDGSSITISGELNCTSAVDD
ncbi:hypothetical protein ACFO4E_15045 [Nocardiopsis mangrovi]|uniref:Lipoprotein n=1 Tax=Nocardiopsis mangrovi TaxID=1179818 RepID=A0ABV9DWN4_9ACTN